MSDELITALVGGAIALLQGLIIFLGNRAYKRLTAKAEKLQASADRQELREEQLADEIKKLKHSQTEEDRRRAWKQIWEIFSDACTQADLTYGAWDYTLRHNEDPIEGPNFRDLSQKWIPSLLVYKTKINRECVYVDDQRLLADVMTACGSFSRAIIEAERILMTPASMRSDEEIKDLVRFFEEVAPAGKRDMGLRFQVHLGVITAEEFKKYIAARSKTEEVALATKEENPVLRH